MTLRPPKLDDRTFDQLVAEAVAQARRSCPQWTDLSEGDPGRTLLELFAFLTETMLYRLNRLPEKAYVEFLRLMGVKLAPPAAARLTLRFSRDSKSGKPIEGKIEIPIGTRVTTQRGGKDAPIFYTAASAVLDVGKPSVDVPAVHAEEIQDPPTLPQSGAAAAWLNVRQPPIADTGDKDDVIVGVESTLEEIGSSRYRQAGGTNYKIWTRVETFADIGQVTDVYLADMTAGRITFGNGAIGAPLPGSAGRRVMVWYRHGGGANGNVAPDTLVVMKDPIAGLAVTNPTRATGGRAAQPLADALVRGPQQFQSLERAVTARDFELLSGRIRGVARARAFNKADVWKHASAGTVQVLLVPDVPEIPVQQRGRNPITADALRERQTEVARSQISAVLDERRPLGTGVAVDWIRHRVVRVRAAVEMYSGEDAGEIESELQVALNELISPLPTVRQPQGWPFGRALRDDAVYDAMRSVPGVKEVSDLRFVLDDVPPDPVPSLVSDQFQPKTWHAISGPSLYRSVDDDQGWMRMSPMPGAEEGERIRLVRAHRARAGWVAVVSEIAAQPKATPPIEQGSRLYVSSDCGETWQAAGGTGFVINDVAWVTRDGVPALLIAGDRGLFEQSVAKGAPLQELLVGDPPEKEGFWTVAVNHDLHGRPVNVAVAARSNSGVWVSYEGGRSRSFYNIPINEDVRVLAFQDLGTQAPLWAGTFVFGNNPAHGCFRWGGLNEKWQQYLQGWSGDVGACYGLAASNTTIYAASHAGGVLSLDTLAKQAAWKASRLDCGLPLDAAGKRLAPVRSIALSPDGKTLMAGSEAAGVFVSRDNAATWQQASQSVVQRYVSLPPSSLFCSGRHEITVTPEIL